MKEIRYAIAQEPEDVKSDFFYLPEWEDRQQIQRDLAATTVKGCRIWRVTIGEATPEELNAPPGASAITKLWIVGKSLEDHASGQVWELCGVFDSQSAAEQRCIGPDHFVGPAVLNDSLPDEKEPWPGSYRPKS